jgi:prefoldin subunit 5
MNQPFLERLIHEAQRLEKQTRILQARLEDDPEFQTEARTLDQAIAPLEKVRHTLELVHSANEKRRKASRKSPGRTLRSPT